MSLPAPLLLPAPQRPTPLSHYLELWAGKTLSYRPVDCVVHQLKAHKAVNLGS